MYEFRSINSSHLRRNGFSSNLVPFIPILKRLRFLEEFHFDEEEYIDGPLPVNLFVDIPIKDIATEEFLLEEGKIHEIAETLRNMKSLKSFSIVEENEWTNYRFSPED